MRESKDQLTEISFANIEQFKELKDGKLQIAYTLSEQDGVPAQKKNESYEQISDIQVMMKTYAVIKEKIAATSPKKKQLTIGSDNSEVPFTKQSSTPMIRPRKQL